MADQLLTQVQDLLEGPIDFKGQQIAEQITTALLSVTGLLAFILGYVQNNIHLAIWVGLVGSLLTILIVIPPWPIYNENPERWLPAKDREGGYNIQGIEVDGKKIN